VTNIDSTNWTSVSEETMPIQGELTVTNVSMDAARFYRLAPAGPPVPIVYVYVTEPDGYELIPDLADLITFHDTLPLIEEDGDGGFTLNPCGFAFDGSIICDAPYLTGGSLEAAFTNTFDASASVDPRSIGNGSLSFHWDIFASKAYGGGQILSPDINFDSPVLTIPPNSMPTLPLISSDIASQYYLVRLTIQHQPYDPDAVPSEQTIVWFRYNYMMSNFGGTYN
jgi:hypothetical protein